MRAQVSIKRSLALSLVSAVTVGSAFATGAQGASPLPPGHAGRWITDARGRVVIVHGINMVYKRPPYYPAAAGFGNDDAAFLARIGFNAVRVGVIWKAVEPEPGVYDDAYLAQIARTVKTLARHGIFSLLDFHQDMYNELFQGEGAPDWAVQDDGLPTTPQFGFPNNYELMPALQHAFDHFWADSPGPGGIGIQSRFDGAWRHVAARFRATPGLLGYELFNEPWPGTMWPACLTPSGCPAFDATLTAFNRRAAEAIRSVDRRTLIFYEPNVLFNFGFPTNVGSLGDREAGFAFHVYCLVEPPAGNGCPSESTAVANALGHVAATHEALLLTEFGGTSAVGDLTGMVSRADQEMIPWLEWAYCPCDDPTGSTSDPLVLDPHKPPTGSNLGSLALGALVEPYPQVVAGTPLSWGFDRTTKTFTLRFSIARADGSGSFPAGSITQIAAPPLVYGGRYAVRVTGGEVVSRQGAGRVEIASGEHTQSVTVAITAR